MQIDADSRRPRKTGQKQTLARWMEKVHNVYPLRACAFKCVACAWLACGNVVMQSFLIQGALLDRS